MYTTPLRGDRNPFVTWIMPLAVRDDVLMHTVLAYSACHLNNTTGTPCDGSTAWTHYASAIRSLKCGITNLSSGDSINTSIYLLAVLLLGLIEVCQHRCCHVEPM